MHNPGIDADHQRDIVIRRGDELTSVTGICRATEFLEPDQIGMFGAQGVEQIRPRGKAVVGAVVDDRRQVGCGRQDRLEMRPLRSRRGAA